MSDDFFFGAVIGGVLMLAYTRRAKASPIPQGGAVPQVPGGINAPDPLGRASDWLNQFLGGAN